MYIINVEHRCRLSKFAGTVDNYGRYYTNENNRVELYNKYVSYTKAFKYITPHPYYCMLNRMNYSNDLSNTKVNPFS